jgi:hypothetical protein
MRDPLAAVLLAGLALAACAPAPPPPRAGGALPPPAGPEAPGLPPLPAVSPRTASYSIDARLDPDRRRIEGALVLEWRNTADRPLASFPFHLYWNAFRNNLSTSARGDGRRVPHDAKREERSFGWIRVTSVRRLGPGGEEDLLPSLRYPVPDGNAHDRTVMEVATATSVAPGETARFRVEWESLIPHGSVGRAGWVHDYHFVAQWFPKIGVFWKGAWNCHPFHPFSEFFSDFGVYDVRLTLPRGFTVGATGRLTERSDNGDGTETLRFVQEDVHDFAWTASRRFLDRQALFDEPGYPRVAIRLLLQPENAGLAGRYLEATKLALRTFGTWAAPYPYAQLTVVDPAHGSASGGMEYPTLFTSGAALLSPAALQEPERLTVHEAGHQFWYGLVANNEFEEAWLDEGLTTYMTAKALDHALGPAAWGRRFLVGIVPVVAPGVRVLRGGAERPALVLQTLEGLLGEEAMVRALRTYARRHRFAHPTTADFVAAVNEGAGQDWQWFFDETFGSSEECDYAVEARNEPARAPAGWFEDASGNLAQRPRGAPAPDGGKTDGEVTVLRRGGVRLPVEIEVELEGGRRVLERWDGRERWKRLEYPGSRVRRATVDPQQRIAIDVDPSNNEWIDARGPARRAATKWAGRLLLWLQAFLELQTAVG